MDSKVLGWQTRRAVTLATLVVAALFSAGCGRSVHESGLKILYGANGIQELSFDGVVLEDLAQFPADAFHIWHLKATDAHGKIVTKPQYGWGEVNSGRTWDAATHSWNYAFAWGSIKTQFVQKQNVLTIAVTETNKPDSGITLGGAAIYPLVLHLPELPSGFGDPSYEHLAVNASDPAPTAEFGQIRVTITAETCGKPLYRGFEPAGNGNNFTPILGSTAMDSVAANYPRLDRPVAAGQSDSFSISLHFAKIEADGH